MQKWINKKLEVRLWRLASNSFKNRANYHFEKRGIKNAINDLKKAKTMGYQKFYGDEVDELL